MYSEEQIRFIQKLTAPQLSKVFFKLVAEGKVARAEMAEWLRIWNLEHEKDLVKEAKEVFDVDKV